MRTTPAIQQRAKELRKKATPAERVLWEHLRGRQLGGFKFRRQAPMGRFIADFYCAECKLIVELDGGIHNLQVEADQLRTEVMESHGYRVIRFRNEQVENDIVFVLNSILETCKAPLPRVGEGLG